MTSIAPNSIATAKRALVISAVVTSLVGGSAVAIHWLLREATMQAIARGSLFVAAMVAVHVAGFNLYRRQPIQRSPKYSRTIKQSLIFQIPFVLFAGCILLSGIEMALAFAMIGQVLGIAIIMCRRPEEPTDSDIQFILIGYYGLLMIAFACVMAMPRMVDMHW